MKHSSSCFIYYVKHHGTTGMACFRFILSTLSTHTISCTYEQQIKMQQSCTLARYWYQDLYSLRQHVYTFLEDQEIRNSQLIWHHYFDAVKLGSTKCRVMCKVLTDFVEYFLEMCKHEVRSSNPVQIDVSSAIENHDTTVFMKKYTGFIHYLRHYLNHLPTICLFMFDHCVKQFYHFSVAELFPILCQTVRFLQNRKLLQCGICQHLLKLVSNYI